MRKPTSALSWTMVATLLALSGQWLSPPKVQAQGSHACPGPWKECATGPSPSENPEVVLTPKQQQVWDALVSQASSIHSKLYTEVVRDAQNDPSFARMVSQSAALIADGGRFRLVTNMDRSLEPNGYMALMYEVNFRTREWCLKAYKGDPSQGPPLRSYCQSVD
jgi:hypothetical protein